MNTGQSEVVKRLREDILSLQGFIPPAAGARAGLGPMEAAFPNGCFPRAAVHEFLSDTPEEASATSGFLAGMIGQLMPENGICLWLGLKRQVFPPALSAFGVSPDRVLFIDLTKDADLLWAVEEALKCAAVSVVVGELRELGMTESRRLQLAVERSRVTGLLHRHRPKSLHALACASRWRISPLPSEPEDGLPGVGFPRWQVDLLKVRNGEPGSWQLEWSEGHFEPLAAPRPLWRQTG